MFVFVGFSNGEKKSACRTLISVKRGHRRRWLIGILAKTGFWLDANLINRQPGRMRHLAGQCISVHTKQILSEIARRHVFFVYIIEQYTNVKGK